MDPLGGMDNMFNKFLGDGEDPPMAPEGQLTMDPNKILNAVRHCSVTEKTSLVEAMSAMAGAGSELEMPNKYKVLTEDGRQIFFIHETTDMCTRQMKACCCEDCGAWNVDMRVINADGEAETAFVLQRPWTCTCCCLNRPHISIADHEGREIASITDPCACCDITFTIKNEEQGNEMYVKGGCCQCGLCCPLPCGPCAEVDFSIEDQDGNNVGNITKKVPSCIKFLASPDVDNYELDLEGVEDPLMKAAIMAVSVFIDFRYFSHNENSDDADGDHIPDRFDWNDDE